MRLLTKEQAHKLDQIAIDEHKILGTTLMQNAGKNIAIAIAKSLSCAILTFISL